MSDHGERIVSLAREMLRAEQEDEPALSFQQKPPAISFKILCFAALLSAVGSSALTEWSNEVGRPINRYEKTELDALVFYAVHLKGLSEDTLRREIENRAGVDDFTDLTRQDYQLAKNYLYNKIQ